MDVQAVTNHPKITWRIKRPPHNPDREADGLLIGLLCINRYERMNLNQVTLPSKNIEESIQFYKLMGFKLIVESEDYARFESIEGDSTFSLELNENNLSICNTIIYFEVSNIGSTVKTLTEKGVVFTTSPKMEDWLWEEARLADPSGNKICIYTAGSNRKNPPWRINA